MKVKTLAALYKMINDSIEQQGELQMTVFNCWIMRKISTINHKA